MAWAWPQPTWSCPQQRDEYLKGVKELNEIKQQRAGRSTSEILNWCKCGGKCIAISKDMSCMCCKELSYLEPMMKNINCISEHEDISCITNKVALKISQSEIVRHYISDDEYYDEEFHYKPQFKESDLLWRYLARKKFTKWVRSEVNFGQGTQKMYVHHIPACVVNYIRGKFPSEDGKYMESNEESGPGNLYYEELP